MPIIPTSPAPLGIPEIDEHHRHLVRLLNDAYDDFAQGTLSLPPLIEELSGCSRLQFLHEERLMAENSYAGLCRHRDEHAFFNATVSSLKKGHRRQDADTELLWFMCNWVTHHLHHTDADFGRYLSATSGHDRLRQRCV